VITAKERKTERERERERREKKNGNSYPFAKAPVSGCPTGT
jgi:hypothetical protein